MTFAPVTHVHAPPRQGDPIPDTGSLARGHAECLPPCGTAQSRPGSALGRARTSDIEMVTLPTKVDLRCGQTSSFTSRVCLGVGRVSCRM